jgi:formate-dependent nitrite reductase membrane component NrfD
MTWAWPIIIYLWLAGIAGGAYFAAFLAYHLSGGKYHGARRVAAVLGVPGVALGVLLLVVDLGHPFRAWHLFMGLRPVSPMSMGSWILLVWAALATGLSVIWWAESLAKRGTVTGWRRAIALIAILSPVAAVTDWVEFFLSITLAAYTGVLLSATSNALWASTVLLPALFVASAVSTGIALISLVGALGLRQVGTELVGELCHGSAAICTVEIGLLAGLFLWTMGASSADSAYALSHSAPGEGTWLVLPATVQAVRNLISGPLSVPFWIGVVLVGLVLPLGTEMSVVLRRLQAPARPLVIAAALMVLVGGFFLRAVIVFGGQI